MTSIPNDLEDKIEYYVNQNKFLKKKLEELTLKYNNLEHEFNRLSEENSNIKTVLDSN